MKPRGEYKIRKIRLPSRCVRFRLTGTTKAGEKIDLRFESRAEAENKKTSLVTEDNGSKERKEYQLRSFVISPERLPDAERAIGLIPALTNSLGEIMRDNDGNPKLDPNYTFTDAMQRFIDTGGPIGNGTERLDEIADAYRKHRQHLREDIDDSGLPTVSQDTHLKALQEFNRLVKQHPKVQLRTLAIAEWRKTASESLTPHAKWSWNVAVCCVLNWAVREKKLTRYEKWLPTRPATQEPVILTLGECQNWADTAWEFGCYEVE